MAKVKRVKISQNKIPLKDCRVKLKRLSRETIERHLKINQTTKLTFNIAGIIKDGMLKIDETTIESNNMVFNVCLKVGADGFSVSSQSSLPQMKTLKQNQKPNLTVAMLQPKVYTKLIDESWRKSKLNRKGQFRVNDIIMAKLRGHPAWPATIVEFVNKNKTKVLFFGANANEKYGFVSVGDIVRFDECFDVIRFTLKRDFANKVKFVKGIKEAELISGVSIQSVLNE